MNERINDLMNEAMPTIDWSARHFVELNNGERMKWYAEWFEKFAELIISDCLDIVDENVSGMIGVNAMKKIEEHFGVRIE
jgi:hypothetical protein